ncbi:MAG: RnfH family protein [Rhodoferax sp.]|nr:RnfH family protein [Rhodoferax sp.]MDP2442386.1 RnfH family protein [Rhodoferax sp.]MDP3190415.1 RnfH family protein [Rhodoferax sp.]MDP3337083.1 RnfH family protein [Rhodoferax sp.]
MLQLSVVYAPKARECVEVKLSLPAPCTVLQALQQSGLLLQFPEIDDVHAPMGVWGRRVKLNQCLRNLDRIEIYRPLRVDPKVARRERFARQGSRGAGLFVNKRAGAKAGY